MNGQTTKYGMSYNGILFSYKKEQSLDTCYNVDELKNIISERSQLHKSIYCMIPFICNYIRLERIHKEYHI